MASASTWLPATPANAAHKPPGLLEERCNIQVVCRIRPLSVQESGLPVVAAALDHATLSVEERDSSSVFTFDHVCGENTAQADFFDLVGQRTLDNVFKGFNGTIMAYGQTGAGKSYTMFGASTTHPLGLPQLSTTRLPLGAGIVPRVAEGVFARIAAGPSDTEYTVGVLMMEIYNEHVLDLLDPSTTREYVIQKDLIKGVVVKGLLHAFVASAQDMNEIFHLGFQQRKKTFTSANAELSRSHAILQITLLQVNTLDGHCKRSSLFLVDLAGLEKADRLGAAGGTLTETKNINKLLLTLGLVINCLTDPKTSHIPYRDLKLTRILQDSLGGNSRTTMIINISPAASCLSETLLSLRFGSRAKKIGNVVHVNTELSVEQLKARVAQLESENHELQSRLRNFTPSTQPTEDAISKRKDERIAELEQELLAIKMEGLRALHDEKSKLFLIEGSLHRVDDKLKDVQLMNENLRRHLVVSERIIAARDEKINKLCLIVAAQQAQVDRESAHFEDKLKVLRSKLDAQQFREHSKEMSMKTEHAADLNGQDPILNISPVSPRIGLNLRIVKPVRGGAPSTTDHIVGANGSPLLRGQVLESTDEEDGDVYP